MMDKGRELLLRYERSLDCVHCGLCLSSCPTYLQTGNETASPRGRIHLMRALAEGRIEADARLAEPMELCLACRACESACPSAVRFGQMMEITRHELHSKKVGSRTGRLLRTLALRGLVPHRRRLAILAFALRAYRRLGLRSLVHALRLDRLLPVRLRTMEAQAPDIPPARERRPLPSFTPASPDAPSRGRVAYLEGCVMPQLLGDANRAVVDALAAAGFDVSVPRSQTCCGALHAHAGDLEHARELARRNIAAFADADRIVLGSAGCGAAMRDYPDWLTDDDAAGAASGLANRIIDVLALFDELDIEPRGRPELAGVRVAYDAPCHLHHAQRCDDGPRRVIARIPGIETVELANADLCCGAAGVYSITHPEMSDAVLADKLDDLERCGAAVLITGNPGCMLQWRRGIAGRGLDVRVMHPAQLL